MFINTDKFLTPNDALLRYITVINQQFDIEPKARKHYGVHIAYQDLQELRTDFLEELFDSVTDWVYSSSKYKELHSKAMERGKSEKAASSEVQRKARDKFRKPTNPDDLLIQGQLGELLLFHFIQYFEKAVPLLRKMRITTSSKHERYGADAIHFKYENDKPIIILGEAKTYTSDYKFNTAFEDALNSIITTYYEHRKELRSYVHEDFLEKEMDIIADKYIQNTLPDVEIHLYSIIVYNEHEKINLTNQIEIQQQIEDIIKKRYKSFDNTKIKLKEYPILNRITYIVFPIWLLENFAKDFQALL